MVLGQFGVQTASIIAADRRHRPRHRPGAARHAAEHRRRHHAPGAAAVLRIGEYVEVGSVSGTIEEIGLFATRLRTVDGIYILAPNSTLWNQPVRNYSRNGVRRGDITLTIGSWNDIDLAQKTMLGIAGAERRVRRDPAPIAFVATVGDSTVAITLRYWTSAADFFATQIDLTKRAKQAFDAEGISVPAPPPEAPRQDTSATRQ